jgi:hypothetical protein
MSSECSLGLAPSDMKMEFASENKRAAPRAPAVEGGAAAR